MDIPLDGPAGPLHVTLGQMMSALHVPGVSVAIIDDYRIAWAGGVGATAERNGHPVDADTLFQAASISKPVTATGALWLVSQGRLDLDQDVNARLVRWKVPANDFTKKEKVTLRRLLSHSAGINVHGFAGYERGKPLPTLVQILDGKPPANNPPIRVTMTPGSTCSYSGGGYVITRALLEDATHRAFADFMQQRVLEPIGMTRSSFRTELTPAQAKNAAAGTSSTGVPLPGQWHLYPELAPDSLWTTPTDLARFAIEIAKSAHGKANRVLPQPWVKEMLKRQCEGNGDRMGLGFGLRWEQAPGLFVHPGANDGFQSILLMDADTGKGMAAMGNSDAFDGIGDAISRTVAREYGWNTKPIDQNLGDAMLVLAEVKGVDAALAFYRQRKADDFAGYSHGPATLNLLGYRQMARHDTAGAIRAFELNVQAFPGNANAYDSLGEAYMAAGERERAIRSYEQSLKLDPANPNAVKRLDVLRRQSQPTDR
ncbi:hypothetical protein ASG87_09685 [Frateuria sp. Soil773]|nr:hypothetical protein ASG87_09685 [Frateuria sp. Soil773]